MKKKLLILSMFLLVCSFQCFSEDVAAEVNVTIDNQDCGISYSGSDVDESSEEHQKMKYLDDYSEIKEPTKEQKQQARDAIDFLKNQPGFEVVVTQRTSVVTTNGAERQTEEDCNKKLKEIFSILAHKYW